MQWLPTLSMELSLDQNPWCACLTVQVPGPAPAYSTPVDLGLAPGVCILDKFLGDSEACSVE